MFKNQIGKLVEVNIDDMVVKTKGIEGHTANLVEVFNVLTQHQLLFNAEKCSFGVRPDKFLGYMITTRGVEANPNQILAI